MCVINQGKFLQRETAPFETRERVATPQSNTTQYQVRRRNVGSDRLVTSISVEFLFGFCSDENFALSGIPTKYRSLLLWAEATSLS